MTELLSQIESPSDGELISLVRGGDSAAYGELYARHHEAAQRLARQLVRGPDADDLVSEAFAKVMVVLQNGGGPDLAFRAYLLTAIRRLQVDRARHQARVTTSDDLTPFDPGVPFQDTAVAGFESGAAAKAFASLPERWQMVLWHLEVEGQKPADIAPMLGMTANSVSALAYRAREGLRQAFLTMHLADTGAEECRWVTEHLGAYVRDGLSRRDAGKVSGHLNECTRCTAMYLELTEVNSNLGGLIAPLVLGAAAAGYLAMAGTTTASAAGTVIALFDRAKDAVLQSIKPGAAAAAAAVVVAGAAGSAALMSSDAESVPPSATAQAANGGGGGAGGGGAGGGGAGAGAPSTSKNNQADGAGAANNGGGGNSATQIATSLNGVSLDAVTFRDDAMVLEFDGLPGTPVDVGINLISRSGLTTFKVAPGPCAVTSADPSAASCQTGNTAGTGPSSLTAILPLKFPANLSTDELSATVELTTPAGSVPVPLETGSLIFAPIEDSEPPAPVNPDLRLSLTQPNATSVQLRVDGVPGSATELVFSLMPDRNVVVNGPASGCTMSGNLMRCRNVSGPFQRSIPIQAAGNVTRGTINVSVSAADRQDRDTRNNAGSLGLRLVPRLVADTSITAVTSQVNQVQGRVTASIAGIPKVREVQLRVVPSSSSVQLRQAPSGCRFPVATDKTTLMCTVTSSTLARDFDFGSTLQQSERVSVTFTVSVPGYLDPKPENNSATVKLGALGLLGLRQ